MKLKTINNNKGSALLWCILLVIILTILLGSISIASLAYFNNTMYTVKRQQAYFTARSAVNILLEEFTSDEATSQTEGGVEVDDSGRTVNFDGNYIAANGDVVTFNNRRVSVTYNGTSYELKNEYIDPATGNLYKLKTVNDYYMGVIRTGSHIEIETDKNGVKQVSDLLVRKAVKSNGSYIENNSISVLPARKQSLEVTDFGFDSSMNMGTASAVISRSENNEVTVKVTAYYPDEEKGEKYEIEAKVVRQPVYFGGIAVKNLTLNSNFILGENTDLYWNSDTSFDTAGGHGSALVNNGNYKITINGNLVTKKDAYIGTGTTVANRKFYGNAEFTGTGAHSKKIWNASEYVISNKELTVNDEGTTSYTESTINNLKRNLNGTTHSYYANNYTEKTFGRPTLFNNARDTGFLSWLGNLGRSDIFQDIANDNFALTNDENNALAIQYIEILSLSNTLEEAMNDYKNSGNIISGFVGGTIDYFYKNVTVGYDIFTGQAMTMSDMAYDILDASYIDYSASDNNTRSDNVVPLTYMFVRGGDPEGVTVRVRYGAKPDVRNGVLYTIDRIRGNFNQFISNIFDINEKPSYIVVYLEDGAKLELGYDDDGKRSNNPEDLVFLYSIYGGPGSKVVLHDGITVVGEIMVDDLEIDEGANGVNIVYSSTNGSQVAKQKIAEYWTISNYKEG